MDRIGQILLRTRPQFRFDTAEDALWQCPHCGPVLGRYSDSLGYYVRAACPCKQEWMESLREQKRQGDAQLRQAAQRHYTYGWIGESLMAHREIVILESRTFANFDDTLQPDAYLAVTQFATNPRGTLILDGPFGLGKTHLLLALCQYLSTQSVSSRFVMAPKFFEAISLCIELHRDYLHLIQKAIDAPLLVIDDIDKLKWSEFREEKWMSIIDSRVNAGAPIAISTNNMAQIASTIGGACADRLSVRQTLVQMTGKSYRSRLK